MKSITIFFDVGSTLTTGPDIFEVMTRKLTGCWPNKPIYELILKNFEGMITRIREEQVPFQTACEIHTSILDSLARQNGYPDISDQGQEIAVEIYARQSVLFPEVKNVLEALLRNGVRMIIASDNDHAILPVTMAKHQLGRYFNDICISETVRAYKPADRFVNALQRHVTAHKKDCYFVGDSWVDVETGKRLGINSVHINRKTDGNQYGADYVIKNLSELLPILGIKDA
jgi:HAD superfamily hydrolase (TIGR01509 family)